MRIYIRAFFLLSLSIFALPLWALEVEGLLTKDCSQKMGLIVHVDEQEVDFLNLDGVVESVPQGTIETLYVFNIVENPIREIKLDQNSLPFLRAVYFENSHSPQAYAFPVRFIEDLLIFYSLDGKVRVQTVNDIFKLRPAPETLAGIHQTSTSRPTSFAFTEASTHCHSLNTNGTRPTRILSDQISIDEYLTSFRKGYEKLESFEERTYLYAKPFLYPKHMRLGLVFEGQHDEPSIMAPVYFQWSTGEPYRFQSFNVVGLRSHEFLPNTEPVFGIRSDVKSHFFHGMFIGNAAGLPAGNSVFLKNQSFMKFQHDIDFEPSFNYLAMMGGDVGPYSLSVGFYYPTFGIRVGNQAREILGSNVSYAIRGMYTLPRFRLRVIGALTKHGSNQASESDVLAVPDLSSGTYMSPTNFNFQSAFVRGGLDYDVSDRLSVGADCTVVNASYGEDFQGQSSSLNFNKTTAQAYVQRTFGPYVAANGFINLIDKHYSGSLGSQDASTNKQEMVYFGSLEFIF